MKTLFYIIFTHALLIYGSYSKHWNSSEWTGYDYCSIEDSQYCDNGERNTMCRYAQDSPMADRCKPYRMVPVKLTPADIERILTSHNNIRNLVALDRRIGPVRNMNHLDWDAELAEIASRWIRQCINGSDPCPVSVFSDGTFIPQRVGENGYEKHIWWFPKKTFTSDIVRLWYKKVKGTRMSTLLKLDDPTNFTQLIWANSMRMGCAVVRYLQLDSYRMVCMYEPRGNMIGEPVFRRGTPCTDCTRGRRCNDYFKGLCAYPWSKAILNLPRLSTVLAFFFGIRVILNLF